MPYIATNGQRIWYAEAGQGDPVLLIMGIGAPGSLWARHAAAWKRRFRCLMPDNRGAGRSSKPIGAYSTADMADDYAGFLAALGIHSARIVGCSMGSAIALQLAIRHPRQVRSMVLCCPWARCDPATEQAFALMAACRRRLDPGEFTGFIQWLIHAGGTWQDAAFRTRAERDRQAAHARGPVQSTAALRSQARACIDHDVHRMLGRISCPARVMAGSEDRFTPPWMAQEVADRIPQGSLRMYRGCGHAFHWERLPVFNREVMTWLAKH